MVGKVKCLLVDGAEDESLKLESALRGDDREIFKATTSAQALDLLRTHDFALAMIILGTTPTTGFELAEQMRTSAGSRHVPIIFVAESTATDRLPVFHGYETGAVDVLVKPVNTELLRQKAEVFFDLHRQRERLQQALQARENALAVVSHDLRTPLAVIHTTTSMLLNPKYQLTPEQIREQLERARRNAELMNRMVGDLMDIVNLRSGRLSINPQPLLVNETLREAVNAHEAPAREKGLSLRFDAGPDVMHAEADRTRLMQLFQNLLGNAIKFCKAGDRVTVTSRAQGKNAQIEIADSGPGIAADDLPHIFDPYYSASNKHDKKGTGLGLYIAKGIVDAHGGQIRCNSQPGAGTTFNVTLPLAN
jgi:two-component system, sensor histidine kinase and response regulator